MNMMRNISYIIIIVGIGLLSIPVAAQTIPIGSPVLEDYYRRLQLLGKLDSSISFSNRPLSVEALNQVNVFDPADELSNEGWTKSSGNITFGKGRGKFQILPFSWQQ
ncbi:MAG: hypothetical protein EOO90_31160, partial [Pedobacter sp.]